MISNEELLSLLDGTEFYRVERTISTGNMNKFCEALCAFFNDMPNSPTQQYRLTEKGTQMKGERNNYMYKDERKNRISINTKQNFKHEN